MDFITNSNSILLGFVVWLLMAPRLTNPRYGELFLAYTAALLLSLLACSDLLFIKPVAFFFTVGGVFAFSYVLARTTIHISGKK